MKSKKKRENNYKIILSGHHQKTSISPRGRSRSNIRPRTVVVSSHSTKEGAKKGMKEIGKNLGWKSGMVSGVGTPYRIIDARKYKITKDRSFGIKLKKRMI